MGQGLLCLRQMKELGTVLNLLVPRAYLVASTFRLYPEKRECSKFITCSFDEHIQLS